jgi:hypothetical protein
VDGVVIMVDGVLVLPSVLALLVPLLAVLLLLVPVLITEVIMVDILHTDTILHLPITILKHTTTAGNIEE